MKKDITTFALLFKINKMNTDVDMTYSFLWDEEPADEQLQVIMQEVGEDVRRESEQLERLIKEKIEEEYARVLAARQKQV
ncbi:MAG: hypothetical protein LBK94_04640 [Prevotellaceae bacterium]|nr:hypothetical protein [Prevotellaceae bacterium]